MVFALECHDMITVDPEGRREQDRAFAGYTGLGFDSEYESDQTPGMTLIRFRADEISFKIENLLYHHALL